MNTVTPTPTLPILTAVNKVIAAVRKDHPSIPDVVVVLGPSAPTKHGHFAPKSWAHTDASIDTPLHEVLLSGESLKRGAVPTFGTIVHELAHAYCHANDIQDTSNRGRYHNKKFKEVAEEFGLLIEQAPTIGYSVTEVSEATTAKYAEVIQDLSDAIHVYRSTSLLDGTTKKPRKASAKFEMTCACGTEKVSKKFQYRHFTCDDCGEVALVAQVS